MEPELKPCPFCGAHMIMIIRPSRYTLIGHKDDCALVQGDEELYFWNGEFTMEQVVAIWNKRADSN